MASTFPTSGLDPCHMAMDLAQDELYVLATGPSSTVMVLAADSVGLITERAEWTAPLSPLDLTVDDTGVAYVLAGGGTELVAMEPVNGVTTRTLSLVMAPAQRIAFDGTDQWLFLADSGDGGIAVVKAADLTVEGDLHAPSAIGALAFDPLDQAVVGDGGHGTNDGGRACPGSLEPHRAIAGRGERYHHCDLGPPDRERARPGRELPGQLATERVDVVAGANEHLGTRRDGRQPDRRNTVPGFGRRCLGSGHRHYLGELSGHPESACPTRRRP